jgi:methyltransferase (TIGR00027 family)
VDHPATQKAKRKRVESILGNDGVPSYVTFVPFEFTRENLASRLSECGYSERLKTLFIWEGVTMYLDAASVESTLTFVASYSASGSAIVFDYMCAPTEMPKRDMMVVFVSFLRKYFDELRKFEIQTGQIEPFLKKFGFRQVRNISASDLEERYFTEKNAGRKVIADYAIALGIV